VSTIKSFAIFCAFLIAAIWIGAWLLFYLLEKFGFLDDEDEAPK
jgi:hypothetical protein